MSRRVALCIGVANYKGRVPARGPLVQPETKDAHAPSAARRALRLQNAVHDATDVHQKLRSLGYDSTLCVNPPDMDTVNGCLDAFAAKLCGAMGVFFFAGHGTTNSRREVFLLTLKDVQHEHHLENCASLSPAARRAPRTAQRGAAPPARC